MPPMSRPSQSMNAPVRPMTAESITITRYRTVDVDGLKLFYREAGASEAPALLLLHGFPTSSHMYRDLIPALADRYHVVAPDLPGFGFYRSARTKTLQIQLRAPGGGDRTVHGGARPRPLRALCFRLRRANWFSPRHSPSRADHRRDLAERQRLPAGFERRLEPNSSLLEGTNAGKSRRAARFPQARGD